MRKTRFLLVLNVMCCLCVLAFMPVGSYAQTGTGSYQNQISLTDLSAFKSPPANWSIAGSVKGSLTGPFETQPGQGILVNVPDKKVNEDIFTNVEHGDIDLSVDFMMPPGSNSGIYLQGRYEIQLYDSWAKDVITDQDEGSVYPRYNDADTTAPFSYDGVTPRVNVSRAPGLWQNIRISFLAPKFNAAGKKIADARVIRIVLNGVTIIENAQLTGPTRGSAFPNEAAMGPLRLQGDHGAVAFRNIKYNTTVTTSEYDPDAPKKITNVEKPVFVIVKDEPVVLRSFVYLGKKIITHAVNVGFQHHLNFSYDLEDGAMFQAWRGEFVDATPMWWFRGDGTTKALGSVVTLDDAPPLATLNNENDAWPDTISDQQAYRPKGYELDSKGFPTIIYLSNGLTVNDKIAPSDDGKMLTRQITLTGAEQGNLYYRLASAQDITDLGGGMYSINNFEYYIQLPQDNKDKPVLRSTAAGKELLMPVKGSDKGVTLQYSMIF